MATGVFCVSVFTVPPCFVCGTAWACGCTGNMGGTRMGRVVRGLFRVGACLCFLASAIYTGQSFVLSVSYSCSVRVKRLCSVFLTLCSLYSRDPFRCSAFLFFCFFTFVLSLRYDPFPMVRVLRSEGFCVCAVFAPCGAGVCVRSFDIHGLLFYCLSLGRLVFGVLEALLLRVGLSILPILKLCF